MKKVFGILGLLLITIIVCTGTALATEQVFYYHTDPAGTPLAMTDEKGDVVWTADYKPFGEEHAVSGAANNSKRFVGKEKDEETGLSNFGARYFDARTGRFIAVDPVRVVDPMTSKTNEKILLNPQRLNAYAYALNNPYRYVDPDGREPFTAAAILNLLLPSTANAPEYRHTPTVASQSAAQFGFEAALLETGGRVTNSLIGMLSKSPTVGQKVYRVFGENNNPLGESWTPVDPRSVSSFRSEAGLPDINTGRFVIEGRINNTSGITVRKALPLDGNPGGITEYLIPNARSQVTIKRASGANPEF